MLLALLSDIHANLEALQACLNHAHERGATRFAFLGDYVGYGADAAAVVATVMRYAAQGALVVKGNHDAALADGAPYMNAMARASIAWAQRQLSAEQKAFLSRLPLCLREAGICCVHGSAEAPERWRYVDSPAAALKSLQAAEAAYTFCGHVHEQQLFAQIEARAAAYRPVSGSPVSVARHRRWLAIVGSVGQPRDGSPAAGYATFDDAREEIVFYRVAYDNGLAARKVRGAGLSAALAYRIEKGI